MPNGYRRGGAYTRNGKTYRRRGATIRTPGVAVSVGAGLVVLSAWAGAPIISSPVLAAIATVGVVGLVAYRCRRQTKSAGRWLVKRLRKWEVFNPADGEPIASTRSKARARRLSNTRGLDYARQGEGW